MRKKYRSQTVHFYLENGRIISSLSISQLDLYYHHQSKIESQNPNLHVQLLDGTEQVSNQETSCPARPDSGKMTETMITSLVMFV